MQQGVHHDQRWVKYQLSRCHGNHIAPCSPAREQLTYPQLWDLAETTDGIGDLLIRDDSAPSDLGLFHYNIGQLDSGSMIVI